MLPPEGASFISVLWLRAGLADTKTPASAEARRWLIGCGSRLARMSPQTPDRLHEVGMNTKLHSVADDCKHQHV
jgi:hypothetical protein